MLSKRNGNKTSILIDFARMQCDRHSNLYPVVSLSVLDHFFCASTRNVSQWKKQQKKLFSFLILVFTRKTKSANKFNKKPTKRNIVECFCYVLYM